MSNFNSIFGIGARPILRNDDTAIEQVLELPALQRALAFTGHTIDDVVNSQVVKNEVLGYYRLHRQVERRSEIVDLERQWNPA